MQNQLPAAVERWRKEVRAALPHASADLCEEIAQFIAERWLDLRARGVDAAEADRQARLDLDAWKAKPSRSVTRLSRPWTGWSNDVRLAARAMRLHAPFAMAAAFLTAIAIAAVVSAFAIIYGILIRPLPYPDADRLAVIWRVGDSVQLSYPDFRDLSAAASFEAVSALSSGRGSLRVGDRIERVNALYLEPAGLAMLGARPALGRLLTTDDRGSANVMISHRLWSTHLNFDPAIVGRSIWISGTTHTVVGVLERGVDFELPVPPYFKIEQNDIWALLDTSASSFARRDFSSYEGLVRLAPGQTLQAVQAALDATAIRLAGAHPSTNEGRRFRIASLHEDVVAPARRPLQLAAVAALVVLAVALVNVAILGLVRGLRRQGELSIRAALGAGTLRLRRQLLTEHALISSCGGAIGIIAAGYVLNLLLASDAADLPRVDAVRLDALAATVGAGVAMLFAATLTAPPLHVFPGFLRTGARTIGDARRPRRLMVGAEIALALTLATAAVLLSLSLGRLLTVDLGFDPRRSAAARVSTYAASYPELTDVVRFHDKVIDALHAVPDVEAAGMSSSLPLSGQTSGSSIIAEGEPDLPSARVSAGWQYASPGYFAATGMRLRAGRDFSREDVARQAHVTIINQSLARALFGDADPIGRRIGVGGDERRGDWHEIIGVVADVRHTAVDLKPTPRAYDLFGQHWGRTMYVAVKSRTGSAEPLLSILRRTLRDLDPQAPVFEADTMPSLVRRSSGGYRLAFAIAMAMAGAGLLLALIGAYAVASATVAERTRELGVRAALGAAPSDLHRVVRSELAPTIIGGAIAGTLASAGAVRAMQSQLFEVTTADAVWIVPAVAAAVVVAIVAAALPPARRAARIDPVSAMRAD